MGCILQNARIVEGTGEVLDDRFVVIDGGKIREIGRASDLPATPAFPVVELAGQTVMPGVIDCHVHLSIDGDADPVAQIVGDGDADSAFRMARNAYETLASGITTVRDLGAKNHVDFSFRKAAELGLLPRIPRLVLSGKPVTMTGGHLWQVGRQADGVDDVRKGAREQLRGGADCVKLMATGGILTDGNEISAPQLEEDELRAAIEEAEKAGKISSAHAHGATGVKNAVRAGVTSVEHAYFLDHEGIELMIEKGTYLVPTSAAVRLVVKHGKGGGIPCPVVAKAASAFDSHIASCRDAWKAGVKLAMGTDAGTPYNRHGENMQELEAMVDIGLSPMQAIVMATRSAAELLRMDHLVGTVEVGKEADLLVLDGDPLDDITMLQDRARLRRVYQAGDLVAGTDMAEVRPN
jgi:imidazolonepropionase-like amidohydrolase